jgi:hypothetical protein
MSSVIYKTLFEVKLLHEYFLTRSDGSVIFDKTPAQKKLFLEEEFAANRDSVNSMVEFEFPESMKRENDASFFRIIPTYSGCKVAVKVIRNKQTDGQVFYKPLTALPSNRNIFILIKRKGPIDSFTSGRLYRPYPSIYYFANSDIISPRVFPYLTNSIPGFDPAFSYEQGELNLDGSTIQEFQRKGTPDIHLPVAGSGFANESDRLLIAPSFSYRFNDTTGLTEADFILKDFNGTEIDRLNVNSPAGINSSIRLNYSGKINDRPLNESFNANNILYFLEVRTNNGYVRNHPVIFHSDLSSGDPWGVIHITPEAVNNAFNLLANDGFLVTREDVLGTTTAAPIFEIPVKSRLVYWRYVHQHGDKLDISATMLNYLDQEDNALITRNPRRLSRSFLKILKTAPVASQYAPNPVNYQLKISKDGLLCYDVVVMRSKFFQP